MRGRETAPARRGSHINRQKLIDYGKMHAARGAGPVTFGIDIGVIKMIITHAAAISRPSTDELNRLFCCFDDNRRLTLPMTRIGKFEVTTAMWLDKIRRVELTDLDVDRRTLLTRERKDPRNKTGKDHRIEANETFLDMGIGLQSTVKVISIWVRSVLPTIGTKLARRLMVCWRQAGHDFVGTRLRCREGGLNRNG